MPNPADNSLVKNFRYSKRPPDKLVSVITPSLPEGTLISQESATIWLIEGVLDFTCAKELLAIKPSAISIKYFAFIVDDLDFFKVSLLIGVDVRRLHKSLIDGIHA